ncbi:glycosyltransferase [Limibaculum sp. FT325]|uniref:glycosyltransferase n=1 Tax=Thermohalobaculum sediminis TaxID=2939436 RepID=UPI0020BD7918|nr:glycosyltransferase [Limibaculum sediminis]MCL5779297.1 glycosyltransferase [Limibaculum sediminis]
MSITHLDSCYLSDKKYTVLFDATRIFMRRKCDFATGIDRVDIRHAAHLSSRIDIEFRCGLRVRDEFVVLPKPFGDALVKRLEAQWLAGDVAEDDRFFKMLDLAASDQKKIVEMCRSVFDQLDRNAPRIFLNSSHANLDCEPYLRSVERQGVQRMAFYIHDLIPIDYPEYVREGDELKHAARIENIAKFDPILLVNSRFTADRLQKFYHDCGIRHRMPSVLHIGVEPRFRTRSGRSAISSDEYFLMVGTIEPRKNHISMLLLWRDMVNSLGADKVPRLVIVGKRGWKNESVFDLLDRSPAVRSAVVERDSVSDEQLGELISGCRALLFPSFVEGWGMPLVEALSQGVPVIASDIPAFHEAGGDVPEFIHPLAISAWRDAILEYSRLDSNRRAEQLARLREYRPPDWHTHFSMLDRILDDALLHPSARELVQPLREMNAPDETQILRNTTVVDRKADTFELPELIEFWRGAVTPKRTWRRSSKRLVESGADACFNAADWYRDRQDFARAAFCYAEGLRERPERGEYWVQYGHMLKETMRFEEAFNAYQRAKEIMPADQDLFLQIGHLFNQIERHELAVRYYEFALQIDPHNEDVVEHLRFALERLDNVVISS